nr:hypothetical protein [Tanacetum cinerariifolium]
MYIFDNMVKKLESMNKFLMYPRVGKGFSGRETPLFLTMIVRAQEDIGEAKEISSLKRRIKRLEKKKRSGTHGLKRLYMVGLSTRVESSDEESLGEEDASKQGRNIADIDADKEITLVDETTEDRGRFDDQDMFDTEVLDDEEVVVKKAITLEEVNATSIITFKKSQVSLDEELAFKLQAEEDEQKRIVREKA